MMTATPSYKVVIVNGRVELLELFETVLDGRRFDVVLLESNAHAYSQSSVCGPTSRALLEWTMPRIQVLSMLSLDDDTKSIPFHVRATSMGGSRKTSQSNHSTTDDSFRRRQH